MANTATVQFKARQGTYISLGYVLVQFNDGYYTTSDPRTINGLRKHPGYGKYFTELKKQDKEE